MLVQRRLLNNKLSNNDDSGMASYLFDQIESMLLIPGAVIFYKKPPQPSQADFLCRLGLLEASQGKGRLDLSSRPYRQDKRGALAQAEEAGRRAVAATPLYSHAHARLGVVLGMRGEITSAIQSIERAIVRAF